MSEQNDAKVANEAAEAQDQNAENERVLNELTDQNHTLREQNKKLQEDLESAAGTIQELRDKNTALLAELDLSQEAKKEQGPKTDGN